MKAVVYERYGGPDVVNLREVPTPTPGPGQVRIATHATTVTTGDWRARSRVATPTSPRPEDMRCLAEIAAAGQYTPFIDRRFTFEQMVEAHRYGETGWKRGSVVVSLSESSHILPQGRRARADEPTSLFQL